MPLSQPNLDDLRFQSDLVDEARKRIIQYCPEWTEYNLSDPGITLIELFAWMTELLVYRLNRVPEKIYIEFLNLLGMQIQPASSARTNLTFWLSTPLPISGDMNGTVVVPEGYEARTSSGSSEEVTFSTDIAKTVYPPVLVQLRKESEFHRNFQPRLGLETFYPFQEKPVIGDTFYLGFSVEKDISGHLIQLEFTCEQTEAVGIRRQDPPLVWEVSLGDGAWQEVVPSKAAGEEDTTGGLNNPTGSLTFYLPLTARVDTIHGQSAYWLRCRYEQRNPMQGKYDASPRIVGIQPTTIGVTVPASHAQVIEYEILGRSNGEPGQKFQMAHYPVLDLHEDETLEIEEQRFGEVVFVPWQSVSGFGYSSVFDRHFTLDPAFGVIQLGPSIRQPDGTIKQYGHIPENERTVRFRRYRYGGGNAGNVPANTLQTLTSVIAYISRVTNLERASGGRDQETMEEVKMRAQRELQAQKRAVTAQDYEQLLKNFSRTVARTKCLTPYSEEGEPRSGSVELLVIPAVRDALQVGDLSRLHLAPLFIQEAKAYLDQYRLLTTSVQIREPQYIGVQVQAEIVVDDFIAPNLVESRVIRCLQQFLSPIAILDEGSELRQLFPEDWDGWEFGKGLFMAEVSSLIQRVPGVKYVMKVQVFTRPVDPHQELLRVAEIDPEEPVTPLTEPLLWIPENGLLCSLQHQVKIVSKPSFQGKGKTK